ncbi:hypothetical protein SBA2_240015 [Acidobacteriia bacterium SbA2]|nr:hypothetical protein SBA2_240015 [Acidobacteriia bacterium SbA2]
MSAQHGRGQRVERIIAEEGVQSGEALLSVTGFNHQWVAASLLVAQSPHRDLSVKRRIDRSKVQESVT